MSEGYRYLAFISYKREDEEWAKWLQHKLEHYKLPTSVRKANPSLPDRIRPVFKDTTDLSGGVLEKAIKDALDSSKYLIVICSPRAAQSPWVCKEVQEFIDSGREEYIIPFIVDGEPHSKDISNECFPQNLRELSGSRELLGININEMGRDAAAIKVASRMFDLHFDELWQRWEREKKRVRNVRLSLIGILFVISLSVALVFRQQNDALKKNNEVILLQNEKIEREKVRVVEVNKKLHNANDSIVKQTNIILSQNKQIEREKERTILVNQKLQIANDSIIKQAEITNNISKALHESNEQLQVEQERILDMNFRLMENQTRAVAYMATQLVERGNSDLAIKLLLAVMQNDSVVNERPYVPEAEAALRLAMKSKQFIFSGHTGKITSIVFTSDGRYVISASDDEEIKFWDVETRKCLRTFTGHSLGVNAVDVHSQMELLVSGSDDCTIKLWNIRTGECVKTIDCWVPIYSVRISPNASMLLATSQSSNIMLYDAMKSYRRRYLKGHTKKVTSAVFSHDGKMIASSSGDATIKLWDAVSGKCVTTLRGHTLGVNSVSFSSDDRFLISSSDDSTVKLWDISGRKCIQTFTGHDSQVVDASYSGDGTAAISLAIDNTIKIWHIALGICVNTFNAGPSQINSAIFRPLGASVAYGSNDLYLRNLDWRSERKQYWRVPMLFSSSCEFGIYSGLNDICLTNIKTGKILKKCNHENGPAHLIASSHDDKYMVSIHDGIERHTANIKLWDVEKVECIKTLNFDEHWCMITSVNFSNNDKYMEKPCARDPRSPVPLTLAVQNSLTL